jgi:CDP-paratose 2-epimerase
MKVLITGGCGFLGSNLAAHYLEAGAEVIVLDALFREGGEMNLRWLESKVKSPKQFAFFKSDIADNEGVLAVFQRHAPFDFICHVGGQVAMTNSLVDPRRDLKTNILGTFNVLEAARGLSPNALVAYSSTNKVYGDLKHLRYGETESRYTLLDFPSGLDENLPLDFSTPYGCSKGSADQYVRDWSRIYGLKTVVFRHSSIYGGRQFASIDQGWVGWFCQKAIEQKTAYLKKFDPQIFTISGSGKQVRDVLHADDLISLYDAAFRFQEQSAGEIFNIGGGIQNSLSIIELLDFLRNILGIENIYFDKILRRSSDQDFFVADLNKVKKILNWHPEKSKNTGIQEMLDWTFHFLKNKQ